MRIDDWCGLAGMKSVRAAFYTRDSAIGLHLRDLIHTVCSKLCAVGG